MIKPKNDSNFSGILGESSTVRQVRGKLVVKNRRFTTPRRSDEIKKDTSKKDAAQARFLEAAHYARGQNLLPEAKDLYATGISKKKRSAYMVAMSDYLLAPKIHTVDVFDYHGVIGDTITVKATDDFMVTKVKIVISDAAGALIEEGDAAPDVMKVNLWVYKATAASPALAGTKVKAIAYDRPGNTATLEVVL